MISLLFTLLTGIISHTSSKLLNYTIATKAGNAVLTIALTFEHVLDFACSLARATNLEIGPWYQKWNFGSALS